MRIVWEKDGCGLFVDDGVLWLFVRDGAGMHSTSLTDETRWTLRLLLMANHVDLEKDSGHFVEICEQLAAKGIV